MGLALAFVTSVSWALGNVFIQRSGRAVGAPRAMLWAMALGGLLSGLGALIFDARQAPLTSAVLVWLGVGGVSGVVAYVCLFSALEKTRLSLAIPLVSSWSLVSGLLSLTVFGETVRRTQLLGAACVLGGVIFVSVGASRRPEAGAVDTGSPFRGLAAALGAGLGFGVMVPAMTRIAPAVGDFGASALVYALGLVLSLPLALAARVSLRPPPRAVWGTVLLTGVFETLGFVTVTLARRWAPMAVVAPVASLSSALTIAYAWLVLRERPDPWSRLGALLASAGMLILAL